VLILFARKFLHFFHSIDLEEHGLRSMKSTHNISDIYKVVMGAFFFNEVLWLLKIRLFMCGASRIAKTFAISFMKEWIRLMDLKSETESAPSFLE